MSKKLSVILVISVIAFAIACSGKKTNNGILTTNVTGAFDLDTSRQKTLLAQKSMSAIATDLSDPSTSWPVTINGSNFSFEMTRRSNVLINIYMEDQLILSKIMAREDTDDDNVSGIKVNTVSHVHAQMTKVIIDAGTPQWSYQETIQSSYKTILGISNPSNDQLSINQVLTVNPSVAVIINTYSHIFAAESFTNLQDALNLFSKAFSQKNLFILENNYLRYVNEAEQTVAEAIASLHEVAKNSKKIDHQYFDSINNRFTSTIIKDAIEKFKEVPVFESDVDSVRIAAPGVLFQYNFPDATTKDVLGVSEYKGRWTGTSRPSGIFDGSTNKNKTIKWIPTQKDVGQSFNYQVLAYGANGKITPEPKNITVTVKDLKITGSERRQLPNQPLIGPVVFGDYFYMVSEFSNQSSLQLEKYKLSDLYNSAPDMLLNPTTWTIPHSGKVHDIRIYNNTLYLATQSTPLLAFDALWEENNSNPANIVGSFSATKINLIGNKVYAISKNVTSTTVSTSLNLNGSEEEPLLKSFGVNSSTQMSQIGSTYLYLTSSYTGKILTQDTVGNLVEFGSFTPRTTYLLPSSENSSLQLNYLYSDSLVQSLTISDNTFDMQSFTTSINTFDGLTSNGSYLFASSMTEDKVVAFSIFGDTKTEIISDSRNLNYDDTPEKLRYLIKNIPEGLHSGQTGAYLFSMGRGISSPYTQTWYIKRHELTPED